MKTIYLYLLAMTAILFAACSDDDNMNSAPVTVSFNAAEVTFKESDNLVNVPIVVDGERNGDIKVSLKVTDGSAISEGHFIVTSTEINIPADSEDTSFNVEMILIDDGTEENDDREFTIAIDKVDGATIGTNGSVKVILKDVDKNPYFKLFGTWKATATDVGSGEQVTFDVKISDNDGYDSYAEDYLVCQGFLEAGSPNGDAYWLLAYSKNGTLKLEAGNPYFYAAYNFGQFIGAVAVGAYTAEAKPKVGSEDLMATYNDSFDRIVFDTESANPWMGIMVHLYDTSTGAIGQYMGRYGNPITNLVLEKK